MRAGRGGPFRQSSEERTRSTATAKPKKPTRSVTAPQVTDLRRSLNSRRSVGFSAVVSGAPQPNAGTGRRQGAFTRRGPAEAGHYVHPRGGRNGAGRRGPAADPP